MLNNKYYVILLLSIFISSCKKEHSLNKKTNSPSGIIAKNAMVVSAREEASKIGIDLLKQGGNAFDAMVGTHLALAVVYPYAGNLAGGGFLVYRMENGLIGTLDFREKAPLAANKDMYLDNDGNVIKDLSTTGALSVGVPGSVDGILKAHEEFGKLPLETIIKPVIELAKYGFVITERQAKQFQKYDSILKAVNQKIILFNPNVKAGDTIKNKALAQTLKRISNKGRNAFYRGKTADILVNYLQDRGGIITHEDLNIYQSKWRDPIAFNYKDLRVISIAPPSSGGICLAQIMKMIEPYDLEGFGHNSTKAIQIITEAERRTYADRSFFLGDPDFIDIPTKTLLSDVYLNERMTDFSFNSATISDSLSHGNIDGFDMESKNVPVESDETTHYSIVDQYGNAISVTTTINGAYGSKLYVDELGIFLNNEMDDFSSKPGAPNMFGLIGAKANSIAPEKRMLSSMTPTIVEKDGDLRMVVGTPGGSTIITSVLQTILNVEEFGMNMQDAVDAPRFHHQWLPDEIRVESHNFDANLINTLQNKGYIINEERSPVIGKVDAILVLEDGSYEGGADKRGDDAAVGF